MKVFSFIFALITVLLFSACASVYAPGLKPGATMSEVIAQHGQPTDRYRVGEETLFEYAGGHWSQENYMARFDRSGHLTKWEMTLTDENFAKLVPGQVTKEEILRTLGHPMDTAFISAKGYEVWSYRYRKAMSWNYIMHFMFEPGDPLGTLKKKEGGIDLTFEPSN